MNVTPIFYDYPKVPNNCIIKYKENTERIVNEEIECHIWANTEAVDRNNFLIWHVLLQSSIIKIIAYANAINEDEAAEGSWWLIFFFVRISHWLSVFTWMGIKMKFSPFLLWGLQCMKICTIPWTHSFLFNRQQLTRI